MQGAPRALGRYGARTGRGGTGALECARIIAHHGHEEGILMADNWTIWQRETAGQSDHGMTTARVLVVFALAGAHRLAVDRTGR
jgi:hypothetical protein